MMGINMKEKIAQVIREIEKDEKVMVLYAVESGSRVWGIESDDSDYDVRGFFIQNPDSYLSIDSVKAQERVIEYQSEDKKVDIVLFDLFKFLKLAASSNPSCLEWINSPTFYYGIYPLGLHAFVSNYTNPVALFHHYASLCRENYKKYILSGNNITPKRYLYSLRGLLNAKYVYVFEKIPPPSFMEVADELYFGKETPFIDEKVYNAVNGLVWHKKKGIEKEECQRIDVLDNAIDHFLSVEVNNFPLKPVQLTEEAKELLNWYLRQIPKWWGIKQ